MSLGSNNTILGYQNWSYYTGKGIAFPKYMTEGV